MRPEEAEAHYSTHPWNINNLPRHRGSTLRYLAGDELITGVQVPPPPPPPRLFRGLRGLPSAGNQRTMRCMGGGGGGGLQASPSDSGGRG